MSGNTNKDMTEYIKQRQGRAIAFFENQLELGDPKSAVLNRPRRGRTQSDRTAIVSGRTTQLSLTRMIELAQSDPSAFRIIQNPAVYSSSSSSATVPAPAIFSSLVLSNDGNFDAFIAKHNSSGNLLWVAKIGGLSTEYSYSVANDSNGNVYVVGYSSSSTYTIYNKDGTVFSTNPSVNASYQGFVVKYNSDGMAQWNAKIIGTGEEEPYTIAIDANDNVYVSGVFSSSPVTFLDANNVSGGTFNTTTVYDVFLVKYSSLGEILWKTRITGSSNEYGRDLNVDLSGNVYIQGLYSSQITLGIYDKNNSLFKNLTNTTFNNAVYLIKYTADGLGAWAVKVEDGAAANSESFTLDRLGNIYFLVNVVSSTLTAYNATGTSVTYTSSSGFRPYIIKYNMNGMILSGFLVCNVDGASSVAVDSDNNLLVCGGFRATQTTIKNQNNSNFITLTNKSSASNYDSYIIKYNTSGFVVWVVQIGGTLNEIAYPIAVDAQNNIYIFGTTTSTLVTAYDKNGTAFSKTLSFTGGNNEFFIVKYDSSGFVIWLSKMTGSGNEYVNPANALSIDTNGNIYSTGIYNSPSLTIFAEGQ